MAMGKTSDLTTGSVFKKLILFTIPIFLTAFMQQLYHSADVMVVGRFAADKQVALAAVGSTGNVTSLIVNLFAGLSVGTSVVAAQAFGAKDKERGDRVICCAVALSLTAGISIALVGYLLTPFLLTMMKTPKDVLHDATLYMRIIFLGQPASLLFNFCSGIFRARGNSKRSLWILTVSGIFNVVMNVIFVVVFHWDAAGVALATVLAHVLSALIAVCILFHPHGEFRTEVSKIRFYKKELLEIIRIGLPSGLNSIMFNLSSVIVATAANTLGKTVVASVSAANSVTHVTNTFGSSFGTATISFVGQNYGAGKLRRVDEVVLKALLSAQCMLGIMNLSITFFPEFFLGFFTSDPVVLELGKVKLFLTCWGYLLFNMAEIFNSCKRAFGKSVTPTIISLVCVCILRIIWVLCVYPFMEQTILNLYLCIPISWGASAIGQGIDFYFVRRRVWRKAAREGKVCEEDARFYALKQEKKNA